LNVVIEVMPIYSAMLAPLEFAHLTPRNSSLSALACLC
jgi:hypothetical protein